MTELLAFRAPDDLVLEIKNRSTKSGKSRTDVIIEAIRIGMELPIEQLSPIEHRVIELENKVSYLFSQLDLRAGELATIESPDLMIVPVDDSIAKSRTTRTKRNDEDYPHTITKHHQPFYDVLIGNIELQSKVLEILKNKPTSTQLGKLLFDIGIQRAGGTAYTKDHSAKIMYTLEVILGREKPWMD